MGEEDFRDKIEEHRQTIENEGESKPSRMSRGNHSTNGKRKKNKNPLTTILLIIFIFIPLSILVYVWGFYEPKPVDEKEIVKSEQDVVEVVKNNNAIISKPAVAEEEDAAQKLAKEKAAKAEEQEEAEAAEKIAQEQAAKDAEMLEKQEAEAKQKAEEEKKKQEANKKTHTVKANETLYRIAVNYYGSGSSGGVEKIKKANGMSSETISVGQTLIIPE